MYVCHDVNVHVGMSWCKCPLVGMSWCKCFFDSMPWCECFFGSMPWCKCFFGSMPWCKCSFGACHDAYAPCKDVMMQIYPYRYAVMQMYPCRYTMNVNAPLWVYHATECFGANTVYSKTFFLFSKRGFHNAWNQNIFTLDLLFMKSHLPFDLRLPKKLVITVRKSPNGAFTWNLII